MRYIFTGFLLLIGLCVSAQTISGKITDSTGQALPFALVYLKGSQQVVSSNQQGEYVLKTKASGEQILICHLVGYDKLEKPIQIRGDLRVDLLLSLQEKILAEVLVKNGEDPAYAIIRQAIKKRRSHDEEIEKFSCRVYTKGQIRLRDYPRRFLGDSLDFEDGDTSRKKMIFLSETISRYQYEKGKENIEVISSRVSGQSDGFGLAAPRIYSFYKENLQFGSRFNPRGFISPLSDNALNYYKFKLEGTYFEDGQMIDHIKVIPRRSYEPLFSGHIDIVDLDWRIHSTDLSLFRSAALEILDTLRIRQLYRPVSSGQWFLSSQLIYTSAKFLGFDGYGHFLNVYDELSLPGAFPKKTFSNVWMRYLDSANKRSGQYWEQQRPMPLMEEEITDYRKKDSLEQRRKDPHYLDSLDRKRNQNSWFKWLTRGASYYQSRSRTGVYLPALIDQVNFNPAEGWVLGQSLTWARKLDSSLSSRRAISIISNLRYGLSNGHFNSWMSLYYTAGKKFASQFMLSGGSRVFQFNNNSPIGERGNTISCLLGEKNRIRSYEARYFRGSFRRSFDEGVQLIAAFQFQDRSPLDNTTDFTIRDRKERVYQPNYPSDILSANIKRHQVFFTQWQLRWQPGVRYIEFADRRVGLGSRFPAFTLQYMQAFSGILGADLKYSKWKFSMTGAANLKLWGSFRFRLGVGGFINRDSVQLPDYTHFNGNISTLATEYLNSFQLLPIYQFSNKDRFNAVAHLEHNFKGFLTNKIPGIRKLKLYLVAGVNAFYIDKQRYYYEVFGGIDNIFKQFRIDMVQSYLNGKPGLLAMRLGLSLTGRIRGDDWP